MKNMKYKIAIGSAFFVALWTTQTALAWYDPSTGRWLNRDPVGEPGFRVAQRVGRGIASTSAGRWINRDANLYIFVANNPVNQIDSLGLKIWVCTVPTSGFPFYGLGRHAYFWDDRSGTPKMKRECGKEGIFGFGGNSSDNIGPVSGEGGSPWTGKGPKGESICYPVDGSDGNEQAVMDCCFQKANKGMFWPFKNDCHNPIDNCLKENGLKSPPHPRNNPDDWKYFDWYSEPGIGI